MRTQSRTLLLLTFGATVLAAAPPVLAGQQPPPSTPIFRASVNLSLLDVVVRDKKTGRLVTNLTQDEFEIDDNGQPQTIASFASVDLPETRLAATGAPASPGAATDRVATNEGPDGRVLVFLVNDPSLGFGSSPYLIDLLHRFVDGHMSDHDQVAIWPAGDVLPLQGFTSDRTRLDAVIDRLSGTSEIGIAGPWDVVYTLEDIMTALAPFSNERKVVVLLGEWPRSVRALDLKEYELVLAEAAAANVAIYPVSVRGVTGNISLPLNILADETGGIVAHRNDFDHVLARIEEDAGSYYLLGFSPNTADRRVGRTHRLRVKVDRPGVVVQARSQYVPFPAADNVFERSRPVVPVAELPLAPLPDRRLPLRIHAACFAYDPRSDTVLVTIHADVSGDRFGGHSVEYSVDAVDQHGRVVAVASGASVVPAANSAEVTIVTALYLKPGMSTIKAAVRTDDGLAGSVFTDVDVPKLRPPLAMSDVELASAAEHVVVIGKPPSFITSRLLNAPVTSRWFNAADTLTIYGEVYSAAPAGGVDAALSIRGPAGDVERRVALSLTQSSPDAGRGRSRLSYDAPVALAGLPAGVHVLEIASHDSQGHTAMKRIVVRIGDRPAASPFE